MSNKPQQITNSGLYLLPIMIGNLVPLVTLPIFTRLLSAEDFGAWALANAYAVVVGGVAAVGLPIALERNFFEFRETRQRAQLLYSVLAFSALSFSAAAAFTWLFRAPLTHWLIGDVVYQDLLAWSFLSTAVAGLKSYYMTFLKNTEQAAAHSIYTIVERLLGAVLTLALIAWIRTGVIGLVLGQLLANLAVLVALGARFLRSYPPAFDGRVLADLLSIGYPLMPRLLFGVIGSNFDKYLIGQVASLGGVGIYSVGQRVANIAFTYMTALGNVFGPQVYSQMFSHEPDAARSIGRYLTPFAYVSTVIAFLIAVFSEEILTVLAAGEFQSAVPIVTILALYNGIQFFGKLPQITFARKTHVVSVLAGVSTGLGMALGATGVWLLGTIGVAWGSLAAGMISLTLAFLVGQRCYRIKWESRKMTAIYALLFGCALLTIGLREFDVNYPIRLAAKLVSVFAFLAVGVNLQVITAENIALARDIVLRRRTAHRSPGAS